MRAVVGAVMPYNAQAESFSRAASTPWHYTDIGARAHHAGISFPKGWSKFNAVYSDIADFTPTDGPFRTRDLMVATLPSIANFAPKTRHEILLVVLRDMLALPADCDGLVRKRVGVYQWRFVMGSE